MKKGVLKIIAAVVALCAALPCAVSPVFANSGPQREHGVTASGAIVQGEKSALAVESEKLIFDIKDFPEYGKADKYQSTVTAEYKFVNTSENTVTTSMAFPLGRHPDYFDYSGVKAFSPEITVDGEDAEVETRHTYGNYDSFAECVKLISDEWYSDDFYNVDLPVTEYSVSMNFSDYDYAYAVGEVTCDGTKARYFGNDYDLGEMRYYFEKTTQTVTPYAKKSDGRQYFYVLGDDSAFFCEWHAEVWSRNGYKRVDLPVAVKKTREITLKEMVLGLRDDKSAVSDIDFYNGVVRQFEDDACVLPEYRQYFGDENFLIWYTYDVQVEPNGSIVNTVTSPIFPTIDYFYTPNVFGYEYLLSPAAEWQSFGTLEIVINTHYYVTETSVGFDKTEEGYVATLDGLPSKELSFSLCTDPDPEYHKNVFGIAVITIALVFLFAVELVSLGSVIFAIVYLIKSRKKK